MPWHPLQHARLIEGGLVAVMKVADEQMFGAK
jgi:hypothetical protein